MGAQLEFKRNISPQMVDKALLFEGESSHGIYNGQTTDDSEMGMCILNGLANQREQQIGLASEIS